MFKKVAKKIWWNEKTGVLTALGSSKVSGCENAQASRNAGTNGRATHVFDQMFGLHIAIF